MPVGKGDIDPVIEPVGEKLHRVVRAGSNTPISELFSGGPIEVRVLSHKASSIQIGIEAPDDLNSLRSDLME